MADNTKKFKIIINGVTESIDAVKKLSEQLKDVEASIDRLKNAKVEVKVSAGDVKTPKVSGNSKVESDVEKEKTKQLELQNEALRQQFIERERLKEQNKEALSDIKAEAKGYIEVQGGVKEYSNTLNGMRQHLKDLKKELANTDLGSEKYQQLNDETLLLNENIKQLEESYGVFQRNVGDYYNKVVQAILDARDTQQEFLEIQLEGSPMAGSLNDLKKQLADLKKAWGDMSPKDEMYEKTKEAIRALTGEVNKLENSLKEAGEEGKKSLSQGIVVAIDGAEYKFDTVKEAINEMRKRLFELKIAGQENTSVFKQLMKNLQDFQREVSTANGQIAAMAKTSQTISNIVSVFKGLGGIASMGQGLMGLFGGNSQELNEVITKFTSLSLVLQGLNSIQDEITSGQSTFAKIINTVSNSVSGLVDGFTNLIPFVKNVKLQFTEFKDTLTNLDPIREEISKLTENIADLTKGSADLHSAFDQLTDDDMEDLSAYLTGNLSFDNLTDSAKDFFNELQRGGHNMEDIKKLFEQYRAASVRLNEAIIRNNQAVQQASDGYSRMSRVGQILVDTMRKFPAVTNLTIRGFQMLTKVMKGLLTALPFGFLLQGLGIVLEYVGKWATKVTDAFKDMFGVMSGSAATKFISDIETLSRKLTSLNQEIDIKIKIGDIGEVEGAILKLNNLFDNIDERLKTIRSQKQIQQWIPQIDQIVKTTSAYQNMTDAEKNAVAALEKFRKLTGVTFENLNSENLTMEERLKAIDKALTDTGVTLEQFETLGDIFTQDEKAVEQFLDTLQKTEDGTGDFFDIFGGDLDDIGAKGAKVIGEWIKSVMQLRQETADAISKIKGNLDALDKQEWQLRLQLDSSDAEARTAQFKKEWDEIAAKNGLQIVHFIDSAGELVVQVLDKAGNSVSKVMEETAKKIERNFRLAYELNERAQKEADKKAKDTSDKDAKDKLKKQRAEENARLELLQEGLDKEIAILEQKRKEELQDADETGKSRETINAIYDKRILEATKKYEDARAKIIEDNNKRIRDIEAKHKQEMLDMRRSNEDTNTDTAMGSNENQNITVKRSITYDTTTTGNDNVNAQKDYYEKLLAEETRYINEKEKLEAEAAKREHQRQIEDEVARFNSLRESNAQELEERKKALDEMVEQGKITQEEANEMLDKLNEAHMSTEAEQQRQHLENLAAIKKHGEEVITAIHKQAEEERQQTTMEALNNMMAATQDFYNDIDKVMERAQKRKTNSAGFIDYGAYRKSIKDALNATKQAAQQIEAEKKRLQDALNNKQISFDDFQKAMKQLNQFAEDVKDKAKELQRTLASSFNTWLGNMMNNINQYTSVLSGMFDTINEMYTRELDAQAEALEKKQEMYDEELEMLEEQLSKQEELTEQHKDKINSTEDELKTARGDRRQALVESLAAEKKAAEESMKQERKLTEEKKANAKKQEQLKKEQDALDKKRKQAEKKAAIVQATINTFTAVTNALSVQPFYVGLALSAVALGLGMANVAQISAQQYGKGGLLDGKSHAQGGIPVGNTGITVEGGEYITNKATTARNLPLLEYINSSKKTLTKDDLISFYDDKKGNTLINRNVTKTFAQGGTLPQMNISNDVLRGIRFTMPEINAKVAVVDIIDAMEDVTTVKVLAGDVDE